MEEINIFSCAQNLWWALMINNCFGGYEVLKHLEKKSFIAFALSESEEHGLPLLVKKDTQVFGLLRVLTVLQKCLAFDGFRVWKYLFFACRR